MFRDLIFRCIGARRGRKIGGGGIGSGLDLYACSDESFTEDRFCEFCGRGNGLRTQVGERSLAGDFPRS